MNWSAFTNHNIGFWILFFCLSISLMFGFRNENAFRMRVIVMLYAIGLMIKG